MAARAPRIIAAFVPASWDEATVRERMLADLAQIVAETADKSQAEAAAAMLANQRAAARFALTGQVTR